MSQEMKNENGDESVPHHPVDHDAIPSVVTPDMLYKLSKKIAQLTKVIYSLNTKNDDLEVDLEAMKASYEEKLQKLSIATNNHSEITNGDNHSEPTE